MCNESIVMNHDDVIEEVGEKLVTDSFAYLVLQASWKSEV